MSSVATPMYFAGSLKIYIIGSDVCVSYAGVPEYALQMLRAIEDSKDRGYEQACSIALEYHLQSNGGTDFLVCSKSRMARVAIGSVWHQDAGSYWIGSAEAASEFQRLSAMEGRRPNVEGFERFVIKREHPAVGGMPIDVDTLSGYFEYKAKSVCAVRYTQNGQRSLSAEEGGFSYAVLAPIPPSRRDARSELEYFHSHAAAYFYEGGLGYTFDPLRHDDPMRVMASSVKELIAVAESQFGCPVGHIDFNPIRLDVNHSHPSEEALTNPFELDYYSVRIGPAV